jgi:hypothetical protein
MTKNLILTPAQAQAAYIAGTALKSVDATIDIIFAINGKNQFFSLWETTAGHVKVATGAFKEQYDSWQAFGEAYNVPQVKPRFDLDKLVNEAKERLAVQLDHAVAIESLNIKYEFAVAKELLNFLFPEQNAFERLLASRVWPGYHSAWNWKQENPFQSGDQLLTPEAFWERLEKKVRPIRA